jgi:hypothetical protein
MKCFVTSWVECMMGGAEERDWIIVQIRLVVVLLLSHIAEVTCTATNSVLLLRLAISDIA